MSKHDCFAQSWANMTVLLSHEQTWLFCSVMSKHDCFAQSWANMTVLLSHEQTWLFCSVMSKHDCFAQSWANMTVLLSHEQTWLFCSVMSKHDCFAQSWANMTVLLSHEQTWLFCSVMSKHDCFAQSWEAWKCVVLGLKHDPVQLWTRARQVSCLSPLSYFSPFTKNVDILKGSCCQGWSHYSVTVTCRIARVLRKSRLV